MQPINMYNSYVLNLLQRCDSKSWLHGFPKLPITLCLCDDGAFLLIGQIYKICVAIQFNLLLQLTVRGNVRPESKGMSCLNDMKW
jgi:hypothetical protein